MPTQEIRGLISLLEGGLFLDACREASSEALKIAKRVPEHAALLHLLAYELDRLSTELDGTPIEPEKVQLLESWLQGPLKVLLERGDLEAMNTFAKEFDRAMTVFD